MWIIVKYALKAERHIELSVRLIEKFKVIFPDIISNLMPRLFEIQENVDPYDWVEYGDQEHQDGHESPGTRPDLVLSSEFEPQAVTKYIGSLKYASYTAQFSHAYLYI